MALVPIIALIPISQPLIWYPIQWFRNSNVVKETVIEIQTVDLISNASSEMALTQFQGVLVERLTPQLQIIAFQMAVVQFLLQHLHHKLNQLLGPQRIQPQTLLHQVALNLQSLSSLLAMMAILQKHIHSSYAKEIVTETLTVDLVSSASKEIDMMLSQGVLVAKLTPQPMITASQMAVAQFLLQHLLRKPSQLQLLSLLLGTPLQLQHQDLLLETTEMLNM